ncbi:MAG: 50S ribosomal protein L24 [Bdellovibrionales bacterium RIFOXYD1_FULL_53_11]|nr:MAG: 50S ribosomal protein L24 [Bdellovibrionales bacterium RIFOXYD1_FULL_53_11]
MQNKTQVKLGIRKNDTVQIMNGREKGKTGKVLRVDCRNMKIYVEKLNMVKRHVKPNQKNPQGGVVDKEAPIHYSNVLLFCQKCNKGVRHGKKTVEKKVAKKGAGSGPSRVRVCKRCGTTLATV